MLKVLRILRGEAVEVRMATSRDVMKMECTIVVGVVNVSRSIHKLLVLMTYRWGDCLVPFATLIALSKVRALAPS